MNENEVRSDVSKLASMCHGILTGAEQHLAYARSCVVVVERVLAQLKPIADQVGVNVGPLAETRSRLHRLLQ